MALLDEYGTLTATEAADLLGMSRPHLSRQCRNLVDRGWARATQDPDDKRWIIYDLTRAGKKALDGAEDERRHHAVAGMGK
jgi:DNA-binding MarR family transcriptional regulator